MTLDTTDPVSILSTLVSHRTDLVEGNERPLAELLAELLRARGADDVIVSDVPRPEGKAASYVYARFGSPRWLVNAHIDTVPPNADWSSDPFELRSEGDRLYALGAADTKGAAAAILAALAEKKPTDTAILFSGDEEFSGVVMRSFVTSPLRDGLEGAIVCEPTNLRVGVRHRGFSAFEVTVTGPGGHSSRADTVRAPLVVLSKVAVMLDEWARRHRETGPPGFRGMCLNVARFDGGIAFNVIPAEARLLVSLRPPPGVDTVSIRAELESLVRSVDPAAVVRFVRDNVPFATRDLGWFEKLSGHPVTAPTDLAFWTEAALLSKYGVDAVVLGPGDIAQAHGPDEWVSVEELHAARDLFRRIFDATQELARSPR